MVRRIAADALQALTVDANLVELPAWLRAMAKREEDRGGIPGETHVEDAAFRVREDGAGRHLRLSRIIHTDAAPPATRDTLPDRASSHARSRHRMPSEKHDRSHTTHLLGPELPHV